ncbi:MAG: single-stranded DNA-binding protein [Deltaproteobacteria bacterium]|nr:single-stranded DNA-binding protein [Deltaproteobacteria bacterium]
MASVNRVILIGNLGADPEKRYTGTGNAVCNLRIATNERWTDKQGQKQERTEWHRVVVYGPQAENCAKYLSKGRPVYIEGSIRSRSWEDQQGQTKYITEVIAQRVQFLGGAPGGAGERSARPAESSAEPFPEVPMDQSGPAGGEEDIPF